LFIYIKDCNTVISGKIGTGMVESLKKIGIKAITEKSTLNPVKAIAKI
jgi:predicted Fe-Mo cluster-binding NifX family protein